MGDLIDFKTGCELRANERDDDLESMSVMSKIAQKMYLMRNDFGLYKVGISADPESRRRQLEAVSGVPIQIIEIFDCVDARMTEQYIHSALSDIRRKGEWFAFGDDDEALGAINACLKALQVQPSESQEPEKLIPQHVAIRYRLGIDDVSRVFERLNMRVFHSRGMRLELEGRLFRDGTAMKLALPLAYSALIKEGFFKPEKSVLKDYIEAISLMARPSADMSINCEEEDPLSELSRCFVEAISDGSFVAGERLTVSMMLDRMGLDPMRPAQLLMTRTAKRLELKLKRIGGRTLWVMPEASGLVPVSGPSARV